MRTHKVHKIVVTDAVFRLTREGRQWLMQLCEREEVSDLVLAGRELTAAYVDTLALAKDAAKQYEMLAEQAEYEYDRQGRFRQAMIDAYVAENEARRK